nr:retrovirus-related Pol polyprotein from transposon 17.6 [Tanacetum cinerariifolium]
LSVEEKTALITILKSHKRAIAWKLSDIKGINPEFCTHKILMEEDFKPAVQHQRRVNPKIHDVVKQETGKALIDMFEGELTLRVGKEAITFNLDQTSRYSSNYNDMTAKRIDVIDVACEEYSQEVLGFSDTISSGNPTPFYDPIEKTALITILKSHKRAIAWKLSDIKGINPEFCTHKILMEEDFEPAVQHQRRVNPKIHYVIKQEMLERLAGNQYYCFLDGCSGYFQIPIDPKDQEKTTFTCLYGTFAYRRMPLRLCNAPGTFQRCMMAIFHDMIEKTMEVFMDDFSVFRNSFQS